MAKESLTSHSSKVLNIEHVRLTPEGLTFSSINVLLFKRDYTQNDAFTFLVEQEIQRKILIEMYALFLYKSTLRGYT